MKYEIELHEEEIKNLKRVRSYFGENDRTTTEHMAYALLNRLVKKLTIPDVSNMFKAKIESDIVDLQEQFEQVRADIDLSYRDVDRWSSQMKVLTGEINGLRRALNYC